MSDLIDRQHAIDEIRFYITEPDISDDETKIEGYNDGLEMAISILSILSSAEPERKWIPVTEALPEDNRQVLVYAQSTHFALAKYDEMMDADGKYRKQWVTFDAWKPFYTIRNVIAWMPLPEPWRGE